MEVRIRYIRKDRRSNLGPQHSNICEEYGFYSKYKDKAVGWMKTPHWQDIISILILSSLLQCSEQGVNIVLWMHSRCIYLFQQFFFFNLRYNWHITLCKFKVYNVLIWHTYILQYYSVQFSRSVVSNSLWPHEPQHARPPSPSPTPGVHPNPCPLSRWCHTTISSSVVPFSPCPQSFPASGSAYKLNKQGCNIQTWYSFPDLELVCCSMQVKKTSWNQMWNNGLVPNWERSMSRLPAYLTCMQSTSCEMVGWMKNKLESRLLGEISITSDMQMTPPLWHKPKRNQKASWWRWNRRVQKLA